MKLRLILAGAGLAALAACASNPLERSGLVAPPATCAPHVFEVYFREGEAGLTDPAREAIRLHSRLVSECQVRSVQVVGLASATGAAQSNMSLSERRAIEVTQALQGAGLPAPSFELYAGGDQGAVTDTGANEPLRRRVEVRIDAVAR